jgi:hypothetical protein
MKKLLFILSICILLGTDTMAQKGQTSEVKSSCKFITEWSNKAVIGKYIYKVNYVENNSLSFVSLKFFASRGGYGYVYLSNQDELNLFIQDLKYATLKIIKGPLFLLIRPKYEIEIKDVSLYKKKIENRIFIYEIQNKKSFVILNVDEVNKLISWLSTINL